MSSAYIHQQQDASKEAASNVTRWLSPVLYAVHEEVSVRYDMQNALLTMRKVNDQRLSMPRVNYPSKWTLHPRNQEKTETEKDSFEGTSRA